MKAATTEEEWPLTALYFPTSEIVSWEQITDIIHVDDAHHVVTTRLGIAFTPKKFVLWTDVSDSRRAAASDRVQYPPIDCPPWCLV